MEHITTIAFAKDALFVPGESMNFIQQGNKAAFVDIRGRSVREFDGVAALSGATWCGEDTVVGWRENALFLLKMGSRENVYLDHNVHSVSYLFGKQLLFVLDAKTSLAHLLYPDGAEHGVIDLKTKLDKNCIVCPLDDSVYIVQSGLFSTTGYWVKTDGTIQSHKLSYPVQHVLKFEEHLVGIGFKKDKILLSSISKGELIREIKYKNPLVDATVITSGTIFSADTAGRLCLQLIGDATISEYQLAGVPLKTFMSPAGQILYVICGDKLHVFHCPLATKVLLSFNHLTDITKGIRVCEALANETALALLRDNAPKSPAGKIMFDSAMASITNRLKKSSSNQGASFLSEEIARRLQGKDAEYAQKESDLSSRELVVADKEVAQSIREDNLNVREQALARKEPDLFRREEIVGRIDNVTVLSQRLKELYEIACAENPKLLEQTKRLTETRSIETLRHEDLKKSVLTLRDGLSVLQNDTSAKQKELSDLEAHSRNQRQQLDELDMEFAAKKEIGRELENRSQRLRVELADMVKAIEHFERSFRELEAERKKAGARYESLEQKCHSLREESAGLTVRSEGLEREITGLEKTVGNLFKDIARLTTTATDQREKCETLKREQSGLNARNGDLTKQINVLQPECQSLEKRRVELAKWLAQLKVDQEWLTAQIKKLEEESAERNKVISKLETKTRDLKAREGELKTRQAVLKEDEERHNYIMRELEMAKQRLNSKDELQKKLEEIWEICQRT